MKFSGDQDNGDEDGDGKGNGWKKLAEQALQTSMTAFNGIG
jgi:hypothetical protein